ncbi:phage tail protein [Paludibacterium denitrificans]|uniref:Phage tail protein n=1 Tax=Paludibacterium denitrificans TaxID=2675226 RepID=A0A844GHR5_9NEIS|nr:phage tail protein [Paludibacterium denitrificans]MTD34035.1 phage tail protein [Paludibacterium denitrificans]
MASTFTWTPDYSAKLSRAPRVLKAQFGDGYDQRVPDGINNNPQSWALTFNNRTNADADAIDAFLSAQNGVTWFWWTPPRVNAAIKVVCEKWDKSEATFNGTTVTATFDQKFDPG